MKSFAVAAAVAARALMLGLLISTPAMAGAKVDINRADAEELDQVLVNVGPSKAKAIVEHREANGPFKSAEDLAQVKGIGLSTVERNRDLIEIGAAAAPSAKDAGKDAGKPAEPVTRQ
ncbi:MAG TPA: ComEA family DNA-binding protein [Stenotrophomonas sp.]|nr:ComEA family DNA-binding protein [Stenotrophomonas sp.]